MQIRRVALLLWFVLGTARAHQGFSKRIEVANKLGMATIQVVILRKNDPFTLAKNTSTGSHAIVHNEESRKVIPLEGEVSKILENSSIPPEARDLIKQAIDTGQIKKPTLVFTQPQKRSRKPEKTLGRIASRTPLVPVMGGIGKADIIAAIAHLKKLGLVGEQQTLDLLASLDASGIVGNGRHTHLLFRDPATRRLIEVQISDADPDVTVFLGDTAKGWSKHGEEQTSRVSDGPMRSTDVSSKIMESTNALLWQAALQGHIQPGEMDFLWRKWMHKNQPESKGKAVSTLGYENRRLLLRFAERNPAWRIIVDTALAQDNGVRPYRLLFRLGLVGRSERDVRAMHFAAELRKIFKAFKTPWTMARLEKWASAENTSQWPKWVDTQLASRSPRTNLDSEITLFSPEGAVVSPTSRPGEGSAPGPNESFQGFAEIVIE